MKHPGLVRTTIVPMSDLEIAFGETRVVIYNTRNNTAVSMSVNEWDSLVDRTKHLRALAQSHNNKPGYWYPGRLI